MPTQILSRAEILAGSEGRPWQLSAGERASPSEFISYLSLTTAFPLHGLVKLSGVSNLGVLEIVNTSGTAHCCGAPSQRLYQPTKTDAGLNALDLIHLQEGRAEPS